MRVVCAPDSFKESMTAARAADAMSRGVRRVVPGADVARVPLSDGGEGFLEALTAALAARTVEVPVADALGRPVTAPLGLTADGTAVIETAHAAGLERILAAQRDVWRSSTVGVGQLVRAALDHGAHRVLLGLGGSATNDGGAGMLHALGVRYLDEDGRPLDPVPSALRRVASVDATGLDPRLAQVTIDVACDVTNPLCGPRGATATFGPQKGATADDVPRLDALLGRLAELDGGAEVARTPGAGAAGGLGYALLRHLDAHLRPGIELVTQAVGLEALVEGADLVLTGEGSVDAQTLDGKTPAGVATIARRHGVPVVVLAGRVAPDADTLLEHGVTALVPIVPQAMSLADALRTGPRNLERAVATTVRLVTALRPDGEVATVPGPVRTLPGREPPRAEGS